MQIQEVDSRNLFQTDLMRNSPLVQRVCRACPRVYVTDEEPFKGHFTAMFGVITTRDYSWNPYIGDLWYLHELWHMMLLKQARSQDLRAPAWSQWRARMISQEFDASFVTEVLVYLIHPELREQTFNFEIWADRILKDPRQNDRIMPGNIEHYARWRRWQIVNGEHAPSDFCEEQITNYDAQNKLWVTLWTESIIQTDGGFGIPSFKMVEAWMRESDFYDIGAHREFLQGCEQTIEMDSVSFSFPFARIGKKFHLEYLKTAERFGNKLLSL
ncbi:MAG: hypothetical protein HQ488_02155 [Parcubacteria group bacterium]|nr:hypothetical protein [Parcubacteria group bacterium]